MIVIVICPAFCTENSTPSAQYSIQKSLEKKILVKETGLFFHFEFEKLINFFTSDTSEKTLRKFFGKQP